MLHHHLSDFLHNEQIVFFLLDCYSLVSFVLDSLSRNVLVLGRNSKFHRKFSLVSFLGFNCLEIAFPRWIEKASSHFFASFHRSLSFRSIPFTFSNEILSSPTASSAVIRGLNSSGKLASTVIASYLSSMFTPISFN